MTALVRVGQTLWTYDIFSGYDSGNNTMRLRPQNCTWDLVVLDVPNVPLNLRTMAQNGYIDLSMYPAWPIVNGGTREHEHDKQQEQQEFKDAELEDLDLDELDQLLDRE